MPPPGDKKDSKPKKKKAEPPQELCGCGANVYRPQPKKKKPPQEIIHNPGCTFQRATCNRYPHLPRCVHCERMCAFCNGSNQWCVHCAPGPGGVPGAPPAGGAAAAGGGGLDMMGTIGQGLLGGAGSAAGAATEKGRCKFIYKRDILSVGSRSPGLPFSAAAAALAASSTASALNNTVNTTIGNGSI